MVAVVVGLVYKGCGFVRNDLYLACTQNPNSCEVDDVSERTVVPPVQCFLFSCR